MFRSLRCASHFAVQPFTLLLAVAAATVTVSSAPPSTHCQEPAPLVKQPRLDPGTLVRTQPDYNLQDGKVLVGNPAKADDQPNKGPGQVDSLDIDKAYQRAQRLAGQAQGKVFKATLTPH